MLITLGDIHGARRNLMIKGNWLLGASSLPAWASAPTPTATRTSALPAGGSFEAILGNYAVIRDAGRPLGSAYRCLKNEKLRLILKRGDSQ